MAVARVKTQRTDLDALIVFTLATFHASFFLLAFLLFLYWQNVLREILSGLNTLIGLGLFMVLWALTWYTTRRALRHLKSDDELIGRAVRWGGVNGALFLWTILMIQVVGSISVRPDQAGAAIMFGLLSGTIGAFVAFAIGAVVGLVLASIDLALLRAARRLAQGAIRADVG